ncbi:hypothetical protein [Lentzea albida]|uniref:Uncharacterized protein n=1 Tax=Lentzea albida TaxID=65499 RepID=A0A1H9T283_9PSEU|nr:hypothetical protein [Lentzea albida]SER91251.1 hypothetical protein SAMN04488000_11390 [Lentzea albida]
MSTTQQTPHRRRFAVILSLALAAAFVAGFLVGMPGMAPLIAVPVVIVCVFAAGFAMLKLRPASTSVLAAPLAVIAVAGLCAFGGHSLWLTAFGEHVPDCEVVSVNKHTSSKSATTFSNDLLCGSRTISSHSPAGGQDELREPGDRVALVLDRTGSFRVLEPGEPAWWRNVLAPVAAALGVAFVVAVLRAPRWKPGKPVARRDLLVPPYC